MAPPELGSGVQGIDGVVRVSHDGGPAGESGRDMDVFIGPEFDHVYRTHPLVLADVGARGGLKANWHRARRHLRVLGFEPDEREFEQLARNAGPEGRQTTFLNTALHSRKERLSLNVARDRGLTSIFQPNRTFLDAFPDAARFDTVDVQEIDADTLDNQLRDHGLTDIDFIKVDTQGSELFVLQGAVGALGTVVFGVEVEVEFVPVYREQPLFADVDQFLRGLGYQLFDLRPCYWKREAGRSFGGPYGQIIWADALYLKSLSALRDMVGSLEPPLRTSKMLRAISIALLYGYQDYALEIARGTGDALSRTDLMRIEQRVGEADRNNRRLPDFPWRRPLSAALRRLWTLSRPRAQGWSVSDADLGNRD
jgi:FkbM family methyltransferase